MRCWWAPCEWAARSLHSPSLKDEEDEEDEDEDNNNTNNDDDDDDADKGMDDAAACQAQTFHGQRHLHTPRCVSCQYQQAHHDGDGDGDGTDV